MEWSKNLRIVGIIFSIILFLVSLKYNFIGIDESNLDPLTRGVLIFVASILLSDNISRIISKNEINRQYKEFKDVLNSQVNCKHLKNSEDAIEYVTSNLNRIKNIDNTHVKIGGTRSNDGIYNSKSYNRFTRTLRKEIERGLVFRDLVGKSSIEFEKKRLIDWAHEKQTNRRVYAKVIDSDIPVINHFILTYHDGRKEVLFGWAYRNDKPLEQVFLSNDKELISYFSMYFENLYGKAEKITNN